MHGAVLVAGHGTTTSAELSCGQNSAAQASSAGMVDMGVRTAGHLETKRSCARVQFFPINP